MNSIDLNNDHCTTVAEVWRYLMTELLDASNAKAHSRIIECLTMANELERAWNEMQAKENNQPTE
jgi:flagellin-specific chaperone FliS